MIREYSLSEISFFSKSCLRKASCILYRSRLSFFKDNSPFPYLKKVDRTDGWWHQLHRNFTSAHACGCAAQCCVGVQRGSIVSVCAAAYELPTLGVDGSRSLIGYEVMAHSPTRYIQNVSVALYCAGGLPTGFLFQGAASGPQQREETGKGLSCFSLRGPVRHGIVTMEEMSLISRRRFMYSSTHT